MDKNAKNKITKNSDPLVNFNAAQHI